MIFEPDLKGALAAPKSVEFTVVERDAAALISQSIYDDKGVIVGQKREEDFEIEMEEMRGKTTFECIVEVDGKAVSFRSAVIEQELRGGAFVEMFAAVGTAIYTEFFKR
jgi:predicted ATP-binding protein involved in virulence